MEADLKHKFDALREKGVRVNMWGIEGNSQFGYTCPTVCFEGDDEDDMKAFGIARELGYPVGSISRHWYVDDWDDEPGGDNWSMTFYYPDYSVLTDETQDNSAYTA